MDEGNASRDRTQTPPDGWVVWYDEPGGRHIIAYRPDVFDASTFDAACLPTVYVSQRDPRERRPRSRTSTGDWFVAVYLEPDVRVRDRESRHERRDEALDAAYEVASAFARGAVDYRTAYHHPPEAYLDELDALTGRDGDDE